MSLEYDPLLPRNQSAPEITGYGYSKVSNTEAQSEIMGDHVDEPINEPKASWIRTMFLLFTVVAILGFFMSVLVRGGFDLSWGSDGSKEALNINARVDKILTDNPLIDGHNDLAILIRYIYKNKIYNDQFTKSFEKGGLRFHVDLPRLKAGKVGGAFWSAFVQCPVDGTDFSDQNYAKPVSETLSQLDLLRRLGTAYPRTFSSPNINSSSAESAFKNHKLISPLAIEGLHQIGNAYSNLRLYHSLGVRYATLTHNCHNAFADAALITNSSGTTIAAPPFWGGVSKRGQLAVREMNRLGILVDISHVSKQTMLDILGTRQGWKGSAAPVIFSHSSAYTLCPHPRNVPDDVLELVKSTRSIVMVNFAPDFISCVSSHSITGIPDFFEKNSTLHQVARHITYIGNKIGYDYIGLGSDFDGIFSTPQGLEDVSKFPDLIAELLKMGVTDKDAAKVVGRNILRVWADVDKVAADMQSARVLPAEDGVEVSPFLSEMISTSMVTY